MPFIDQAGAGSTADVINGAGDRIRQGMDQGRARAEAQAEHDRATHPLNQKWLQMVINGEMSPADAAAQAHAEHDDLGTPHYGTPGQPSRLGAIDEQGGSGMSAAAEPVPQAAIRQSNDDMTGMSRPMNSRDIKDAEGISQIASRSSAAQTNKIFAKNAGAQKVAETRAGATTGAATIRADASKANAGTRSETADKDRKLREKALEGHLQYQKAALQAQMDRLRESIKGRLDAAREGKTSKADSDALKVDAGQLKSLGDEIVKLYGAIAQAKSMDPDFDAGEMEDQINQLKRERDTLQLAVDQQIHSRGGREGLAPPGYEEKPPPGAEGPTYRPDGRGMHGPGGSGGPRRTLDTSTPVREPQDPSALPSRQGSSTGSTVDKSGNSNDMVMVTDLNPKSPSYKMKRPILKSVVESALAADKAAGVTSQLKIEPYQPFGAE